MVVSATLLSAIINGLLLGAFFALIAAGFSLVWASMRVVNIAHTALVLLAGYVAYSLSGFMDIVGILIVIPPVMFVLGITMYKLVVEPSYRTEQFEAVSLIATFGVAVILENVIHLIYGVDNLNVSSAYRATLSYAGVRIPSLRLLAAAIALVSLTALYLLMYHTKIGLAVRAAWQDQELAVLHGIEIDRQRAIMFGTAIALAGIAGGIFPTIFAMTPDVHWRYLVILFLIVIVGGVGSLVGTVVAGLFVGLTFTVLPLYVANAWVPVILYVLLGALLILRPTGLFAGSGAHA